jgi:ribonuclease Z
VRVTFLGTSAGSPTRTRNVTAQLLRFEDGRSWMLDCGEGTQHRLIHEGLRAKPIERILITHLHGDHCYGLPGLLSLMAIHGRSDPVVIHGPPGLRELVETSLRLSCNHLPYALSIHEIEATGQQWLDNGWSISAWPLQHRIPSWGYVIQEPERRGRFHPERAQAQGVPPGPLYKRLQAGDSITLDDGRVVLPETVCDPPRPGRKLVLLGDTAGSTAIHAPGQDCDLLVHEATYAADRTEAAITWGHSTAPMAGACAAAMNAKRLVLTHVSARYDDGDSLHPSLQELVGQAAAECPGTEVHIADDHYTINVP